MLDRKYRLEERLGEGAHGIVYRALHLGLKRSFAVKLLPPSEALDPLVAARFRREAEALGRLRHPHIVSVTDFGLDEATGSPYLAMELLQGASLAAVCEAESPMPAARALPILSAIAEAIDAAHQQGVLHRDLKPANVMLTPAATGGPDARLVRVLDFGLAELSSPLPENAATARRSGSVPAVPEPARAAEGGARPGGAGDGATARGGLVIGEGVERLTASGVLLGTPLYLAPELVERPAASRASDIYSFGVIAYEMLAGHPPFRGSTGEVLAGHLHREPPPPDPGAAVHEEIWRALRAPLSKAPGRRPASATAVVRRLEAAAEEAALAGWQAATARRRRALSLALAATALVAGWLLGPRGFPPLERWAFDLRLGLAPPRPPDGRILLVNLDEASLGGGAVPLAERADEIAGALEGVFAAGARGAAIDLLASVPWSRSPAFARLLLRHPERLTLAAFSSADGRVLGTECAAGLATSVLGQERVRGLFGFVNVDQDPDGVTRRLRLSYRDRGGHEVSSWAAHAAAMLPGGGDHDRPARGRDGYWIDYRIDRTRFARISFRALPAALAVDPGLFRGRLVLLGGDLVAAADDVHHVPASWRAWGRPAEVSGLTLQALMVATIAGGLVVRDSPFLPVLAGTALALGLAAASVLGGRPGPAAALVAAACLLYFGVGFPVFARGGLLLPVTLPLLFPLPGLAVALALRRALLPRPGLARRRAAASGLVVAGGAP